MPIDPTYIPVGLHELAHRFGLAGKSERTLRDRIDWLVSRHGFPPHLPSPRANQRFYDRRAVTAWFDARVPGNLREAALGIELTPWATVLDARAELLGA